MSLTLDREEDQRLMREEMSIARKYIGPFPVVMALWCFTNLLCWLALWPLVIYGILPPLAGLYHCDRKCSPVLPAIP